jgi:solute carrier family 5 (sodium-coupled monocarboxylate transporter), member 8/12
MFSGVLIICARGIYDAEGLINLLNANKAGGRLNLFDLNPDPFIRQSVWSIFFGMLLYTLTYYSFDQSVILRFNASKSKRTAQRSLLLNLPGIFIIISLCTFTGLVVYSFFKDCDPFLNGDIKNPNEILSYYFSVRFSMFQGISGMFLGSIFSGALSSVSSMLNGCAIIIWQDYIKRFSHFQKDNHGLDLKVNKLLVLFCGAISTGLAYVMSMMGDNLFQISTTLNGALAAPMAGLFFMGCFTSVCDKYGAIIGSLIGTIFTLTLSFGRYIKSPNYIDTKLPVDISGCNQTYFTEKWNWKNSFPNYTIINPAGRADNLRDGELFLGLSYFWILPVGTLICMLFGIMISLFNKYLLKKDVKIDKNLIIYDLTGFLKSPSKVLCFLK